jgi:hypothetical protein
MVTEDIWQRVDGLMKRALEATSGVDLPADDNWHIVVAVKLYEAYERLASIFMLLVKGHRDSADVLTRSLFEVAVNVSYIAKDVEKRLPEYLRHGGFPLSKEDVEQIEKRLRQKPPPQVKDIVPGQTWRQVSAMCDDLGWSEEYYTFYRFVSTVDHNGSFKLATSYLQLLKREQASVWDKSAVLVTALCFYLRVAEVAATVFPNQIKAETIADLSAQCNEMGQFFAKR